MTYVITENCIKCKYTDCVEVCPVDCFHEGPNFLVINPEECIDCSLCEPECPINAILSEDDLKEEDKKLKKYVPLSKRQDKPDSVLWLIKNHSQLKDSQIAKLVGITKNSVVAIRNKSYWNFNSLNPKDPVAINLFSQKELTEALEKAERRIKREKKLKEKAEKQNLQTR